MLSRQLHASLAIFPTLRSWLFAFSYICLRVCAGTNLSSTHVAISVTSYTGNLLPDSLSADELLETWKADFL